MRFTKSSSCFIKLFVFRGSCLPAAACQEIRDFKGRALEAAEQGNDGELQVLEQVGQKRQRALLAQAAAPAAGAADRKLKRVATFWWLLALDNSLKGIGGLKMWKMPAERAQWPEDPLDWRLLILSPDSGSDGWAAMNWMDQNEFCCDRTPDPSHGVWNDGVLAAGDSGLGVFLLILSICCNLPFMPWNDGRFGAMIAQSAADYCLTFTCDSCLFFKQYLKQIIAEKNLAVDLGAEGCMEQAWQSMLESWSLYRAGSKIGLCRFFFFRPSRAWRP